MSSPVPRVPYYPHTRRDIDSRISMDVAQSLLSHCSPLPSQIHRRNLLPFVAKLSTDREPRLLINCFLLRRKLFRGRPAGRGCRPTRQGVITCLRILMAKSVQLREPDADRQTHKETKLLDVLAVIRNQRPLAGT